MRRPRPGDRLLFNDGENEAWVTVIEVRPENRVAAKFPTGGWLVIPLSMCQGQP